MKVLTESLTWRISSMMIPSCSNCTLKAVQKTRPPKVQPLVHVPGGGNRTQYGIAGSGWSTVWLYVTEALRWPRRPTRVTSKRCWLTGLWWNCNCDRPSKPTVDSFLLRKTNEEKDGRTKTENDMATLKDYEKEFAHWTFVESRTKTQILWSSWRNGKYQYLNIRLPPEGKWDKTNTGQLCTNMEWSEHTGKSHPWSSFYHAAR